MRLTFPFFRHSGANRNPVDIPKSLWVPAGAGMTTEFSRNPIFPGATS